MTRSNYDVRTDLARKMIAELGLRNGDLINLYYSHRSSEVSCVTGFYNSQSTGLYSSQASKEEVDYIRVDGLKVTRKSHSRRASHSGAIIGEATIGEVLDIERAGRSLSEIEAKVNELKKQQRGKRK